MIKEKNKNTAIQKSNHIKRLLAMLDSNFSQAYQLHNRLLESQHYVLNLSKGNKNLTVREDDSAYKQSPVFSKDQLHAFGSGPISKCFGPKYIVLDDRKSPRIPNGELLMIDQINQISGEHGKLKPPAAISAEFKIKQDAWFIRENIYPGVPLSILMEIALQPCGILSAFLGTSLLISPENNRFRNLDGFINFTDKPNLIGKTIINHSELLDSFSSGGMYIQKYAFSLSVDSISFLRGESSFGYFTQEAMERQAGLGKIQSPINNISSKSILPNYIGKNKGTHFDLVDNVRLVQILPETEKEVIFGEKTLSPNEWFYSNHFFQDPVMPGSLGAEAIMQGLWAYIENKGYLSTFNRPVVSFSNKHVLKWKYRGQVIPRNNKIQFQIQIQGESQSSEGIDIIANADFWVDDLCIYSFKNISLSIREG